MTRLQFRSSALLALILCLAALPALAEGAQGVVNINSASAEELMFLPRIGPAVAQRIVEFREANGRFKTTEDLMLVRGIGEKTYELLRPYVTVDGATSLKAKVPSPRPAKGEAEQG
jgi:competence protein ComEA